MNESLIKKLIQNQMKSLNESPSVLIANREIIAKKMLDSDLENNYELARLIKSSTSEPFLQKMIDMLGINITDLEPEVSTIPKKWNPNYTGNVNLADPSYGPLDENININNMKKSELRQLIKEELSKKLTEERKGKHIGKFRSPKGSLIDKYIDDEGNEYILVKGMVVDLTDGNGSPRPMDSIMADIKSAVNRPSIADYKKSMRGY